MSNYPDGADECGYAPWHDNITEDCERCGYELSHKTLAEDYDGSMCRYCYEEYLTENEEEE
jgi:hypothetical protein